MDGKLLFEGTISTAAKAMDLRSRRHEVLISNLANADTPGYKAFDLLVEESMAKQAGSKSQGSTINMVQTHPGHLPTAPASGHGVRPQIVQRPEPNNLRGDGNSVDMDKEMANLAENQLMYRAAAQIISKKFIGLKNIIKGGK